MQKIQKVFATISFAAGPTLTGTAAALRAESVVYSSSATLCPGEYNGYSAYYYFGSGFRYFYSGGDSWAWNSGGYYNWYNTIPGKVQNP